MSYFEKKFNIDNSLKGEVKVICPFHNDTNPSATVNLDKRLFHCWVCGDEASGNEAQVMAKLEGITEREAYNRLATANVKDLERWETQAKLELWMNPKAVEKANELGFGNETMDRLKIGLIPYNDKPFLAFPVFFNGVLKDIRMYNMFKHDGMAKLYSNDEAESGWVIPYDEWKDSKDLTYIFEGERDMLHAASLGLNAITLTGGASSIPNIHVIESFRDRDVVIVYDNDDAGRNGVVRVSKALKDVAHSVKWIDMSKLLPEVKGGDFSDYIDKGNTVFDFMTVPHLEVPEEEIEIVPHTSIQEALNENLIKRPLRTEITVTGELSDAFVIPTLFKVMKTADDDDNWKEGEEKIWQFDVRYMQQILPLIEVDAKDLMVHRTLLSYAGVGLKEKNITTKRLNSAAVYKSAIDDAVFDGASKGIEAYSMERLEVGKKYEIDYTLHPHPNKNQKIVAMISRAEALDSVDDFVVDHSILNDFRYEGTIIQRLNHIYQSTKHHIAPHMNFDIWLMTDLVFNSILEIDYGGLMRGALDVFVLGDTEIGKSETSDGLRRLYDYGHTISLLESTTIGLIGGSNKQSNDTYAITIGALPRQNKKLAILEEFSGAPPDFIKKMTNIRSSGEVRIARASGELVAECRLRMITLSNPINDINGHPRFLSSFPNGTVPIMELVKSAEDVRRYDGFLLIAKQDNNRNPFENRLTGVPIPKESYEHKVRWVESRSADDVVISNDIASYIWEQASEMNNIFESNVPIFGTTTSKKLARFCVAMASLILELDEDGRIVVTKEVVDYTVSWLTKIYKTPQFRLDDVRTEWLSYSDYDEDDLLQLQGLYQNNTVLMDALSTTSQTTQNNLMSISGAKRDDFNLIFNKLVQLKIVRLSGFNVYPSEKFRKMYHKIDKSATSIDLFTKTNGDTIDFKEVKKWKT